MAVNTEPENEDRPSPAIAVFLAEDHAIVREGLKMLLAQEDDIKILGQAGNGREAVRQVKHLLPDIVLMDIAMPELNGIEATRQIRESAPATEVVILSMYATDEHVYQALSAGARGYVLKESVSEEVIRAIRAVHAGHRYLSEKISDVMIEDYVSQRGSAPGRGPLDSLSNREREVLQLVVEGKSSKEIAKIIHLSAKTVDTYRSRMMHKLGVHDLATLVKFAIEHGLSAQE